MNKKCTASNLISKPDIKPKGLPNNYGYEEKFIHLILLIAMIALCGLSNGCFAITGENRYELDHPPELIKAHKNSNELIYSRVFDSPDFNLDVGVKNGPERWQVGFFFYVIPWPYRFHYMLTQPIEVDVDVEPKSAQVTFDPSKVFCLGTNQLPVPPAHIRHGNGWLDTNTSTAFPVTNDTVFHLLFSPTNWIRPDQDLPFKLSIEGIEVSDRPISLPLMTFRPKALVEPGFRLPY